MADWDPFADPAADAAPGGNAAGDRAVPEGAPEEAAPEAGHDVWLEPAPEEEQWYGRYFNSSSSEVQASKYVQVMVERPQADPDTMLLGLIHGAHVSDPASMVSTERVPRPWLSHEDWIPRAKVSPAFCMFAPGDINTAQGNYYWGKSESYPTAFGGQGSGIVTELNASARRLTSIREGDTVTSFAVNAVGDWQLEACNWAVEEFVCDARNLICIPKGISLEDACFVCGHNEATAYQLIVTCCANLKPGDWILQNLANSRVGRNVIRIAQKLGFKTANIVRSERAAAQCWSTGATAVVVFNEDERGAVRKASGEVAEATGGAQILHALNGVGGASARLLLQCLAPRGRMVTYGGMGTNTSIDVSTRQVLFEHKILDGYMMWDCWIPGFPDLYYSEHKKKEMIRFLVELFMELGPIEETDVYELVPLTEAMEAFRRGAESINGKTSFPRILFKCCDQIWAGPRSA